MFVFRRALVLALLLVPLLPAQSEAHVVRPVERSQCVYNWRTTQGAERQVVCFADWFGVDVDTAVRVARCESGMRWNADNPSSSAGGLWQFLASTWASNIPHYFPGRPYASRYNARYATITAMRKIRHEGFAAWSCH